MGFRLSRVFAIVVAAMIGWQPLEAQERMDFSGVTSAERARELAAEGKLFKILLFPAEFGGEDVQLNTVYVPPGIKEIKDQITGTLIRMVEEGSIDKLNVVPEYKGSSFIPARIRIRASHSSKPGSFEPVIEIW